MLILATVLYFVLIKVFYIFVHFHIYFTPNTNQDAGMPSNFILAKACLFVLGSNEMLYKIYSC